MLHNFITGINYVKLIQMQANQESFAPHAINRGAQLKLENKKVMTTVKSRKRMFSTQERKEKKKPKVKVLTRENKEGLLQNLGGGSKNV